MKDYMEVALSRNLKSVVTKILNAHVHFGYASGCHTTEDVFLAVYNPNGQVPMGWIDGKVRVPANRSYIEVDGRKKELASVSVYVPKNKNFYISREILNYL